MGNIGLSLSHSVQIQFIAVDMSSFANRPIHRLGSSLNSNMSFSISTLANCSYDVVDK